MGRIKQMTHRPHDAEHDFGLGRALTVQETALLGLRSMILRGELRPGEQIIQDHIADQLGVSRVPIREALKTLEADGHASYSPNRGYFVAELRFSDLLEAYEIRAMLEDGAIRRSMTNKFTREDLARMRKAAQDVEHAHRKFDIIAMTAANRRFHFAMFEPSLMPRLINFIRILWESTDPYRSLYYASSENRQRVNDEHAAIIKAVKAKDVDLVLELTALHRVHALMGLESLLSPMPEQPQLEARPHSTDASDTSLLLTGSAGDGEGTGGARQAES